MRNGFATNADQRPPRSRIAPPLVIPHRIWISLNISSLIVPAAQALDVVERPRPESCDKSVSLRKNSSLRSADTCVNVARVAMSINDNCWSAADSPNTTHCTSETAPSFSKRLWLKGGSRARLATSQSTGPPSYSIHAIERNNVQKSKAIREIHPPSCAVRTTGPPTRADGDSLRAQMRRSARPLDPVLLPRQTIRDSHFAAMFRLAVRNPRAGRTTAAKILRSRRWAPQKARKAA